MLYRPFLHYISRPKNEGCDERPYASAANCVNVSRKIVHTAGEMGRLGILNGAYWFTMYTCFFSVITLVYFVLENPEELTSLAVLRDAEMGRELLASMRDRSQAAKRCSVALAVCYTLCLKGYTFADLSDALWKPSGKPPTGAGESKLSNQEEAGQGKLANKSQLRRPTSKLEQPRVIRCHVTRCGRAESTL